MKSVRIRSYSGPYFPTVGMNTQRYSVSFRIQFECEKKRARITPNTYTFYAVIISYFRFKIVSDHLEIVLFFFQQNTSLNLFTISGDLILKTQGITGATKP